jgi:hypothetical protein
MTILLIAINNAVNSTYEARKVIRLASGKSA